MGTLITNQNTTKNENPCIKVDCKTLNLRTYIYGWPKYFTDKLDQICYIQWWVDNLDKPVEYIEQMRECLLNDVINRCSLLIRFEPKNIEEWNAFQKTKHISCKQGKRFYVKKYLLCDKSTQSIRNVSVNSIAEDINTQRHIG